MKFKINIMFIMLFLTTTFSLSSFLLVISTSHRPISTYLLCSALILAVFLSAIITYLIHKLYKYEKLIAKLYKYSMALEKQLK